jgi:hypothetical protein
MARLWFAEPCFSVAGGLFEDAVEEFAALAPVLAHLQEWKQHDPQSFGDAYANDSVHDIVAPYARAEVRCYSRCSFLKNSMTFSCSYLRLWPSGTTFSE